MRSDFARRNDDLKRRLGVSTDESGDEDEQPSRKLRRTNEEHKAVEMDLSSGDESQFRPPLPPGNGLSSLLTE